MRLALQEGCEVEVVCFEFNNWSYAFNQQIMQEFKEAKVHIIQAGRKPFLPWAVSVFLEQFLRVTARVIPLKGWALSQSVSRRTYLLIRKIKTLAGNFDMVVGHNPGALYPTYFAGKRFQSKTGFDVEDYHPGEGDDKKVQGFTKKLMNTYLPKMDYVSFASPLMKNETISDIGKEGRHWVDVYNFFSREEFSEPRSNSENILKIVWFSQNVNYKRGLEQVIPVLDHFKDSIELTLIGNRKEIFFENFLSAYPFVKYLPPMDQQSLHKKLSEFDVGLAIEPGKDDNNLIAWSNKLLTYFQTGLFVLATDTPAHRDFLNRFPMHGIALPLQEEYAQLSIEKLLAQSKSIKSEKQKRFYAARSYGWEREAEKLLEVWNLVTKQMDAEHHRQRISSW